jgi:hypothetical protein
MTKGVTTPLPRADVALRAAGIPVASATPPVIKPQAIEAL